MQHEKYKISIEKLKYSEFFVIFTAANCLKPKYLDTALLSRELIIYFGAYNLSDEGEINRFSLSPSQIVIHEDWITEDRRFDADIAILVFDEKIHFTRFIKPVCIWKSPIDPEVSEGVVVGWGKSEDTTESYRATPRQLKVPVHNNEDCFFYKMELAMISSSRTFCAGAGNGSGVNLGDGGHGLFTKFNNVFYLTGIVSSCLVEVFGGCDLDTYSIFTNILKFKKWIWNILEPAHVFPSTAIQETG